MHLLASGTIDSTNSRSQLQRHRRSLQRFALVAFLSAAASGCVSVPGETLASGGVKRDVARRVLAQANAAAPQCKNQSITDTEVLDVHPDGKVAAERWTVEQCGRRLHYQVVFPANGKSEGVQVRPE